ncbi:hypothetical protein V2J09_019718 [Rumex salicifolius]
MRTEDNDESNRKKEEKWTSPWDRYEKEEGMKLWGIVIFGLIGATVTTFAVGQLRRTVDWFSQQVYRSQSSSHGGTKGSFRSVFQEEAWRKYQRRMQEEYEEEMARVERIRRMQSVFNRERNKHRQSYQRWRESGPGEYHQHSQREDWYWKTDTSFRDQRNSYREAPKSNAPYSLSHHYAVLGLNRTPAKPYTEAEIKSAFRAKAMEFHPDQNQGNKETAEAKFKEVLTSYEAIKSERKNTNP